MHRRKASCAAGRLCWSLGLSQAAGLALTTGLMKSKNRKSPIPRLEGRKRILLKERVLFLVNSRAGLSLQFTVSDDHLATQNRCHWPAFHLQAFVRGVIAAVMKHGLRNCDFPLRVPQRQIRVGSYGDCTLLRVKSVDLCMVGGRQRDKLMESDPPSSNAFGKQKRKARFDSWDSIRYRPKALKNWRCLFPTFPFEAKRTMIGG